MFSSLVLIISNVSENISAGFPDFVTRAPRYLWLESLRVSISVLPSIKVVGLKLPLTIDRDLHLLGLRVKPSFDITSSMFRRILW